MDNIILGILIILYFSLIITIIGELFLKSVNKRLDKLIQKSFNLNLNTIKIEENMVNINNNIKLLNKDNKKLLDLNRKKEQIFKNAVSVAKNYGIYNLNDIEKIKNIEIEKKDLESIADYWINNGIDYEGFKFKIKNG